VALEHEDFSNTNFWTNPNDPLDGRDNDGNDLVDDVRGWDFGDNDNDVSPDPLGNGKLSSHGTSVTSILAGSVNNGVGIAGVADGVTILPLKVTHGEVAGPEMLARAIRYAVSKQARIINISFDLSVEGQPIDAEVASALEAAFMADYNADGKADVLVVVAAGDKGEDGIGQANPAELDESRVLFVAETNRNDMKVIGSDYGRGIDVSAPGARILAAIPEAPFYEPFDGTSASAPIVSGVAALIWSIHPDFTRDQVVAQLVGTADDIDTISSNTRYTGLLGFGRVNARRALAEELPAPQVRQVLLTRNTSGLNGFEVYFSQILDGTSVANLNSYRLIRAGGDGGFLDGNELEIPLFTFGYQFGSPAVELGIAAELDHLPSDDYRLIIFGSRGAEPGGIRNPFGTFLLRDHVFEFSVTSGTGRTGDVIPVDLKGTLGGSRFESLRFPSFRLDESDRRPGEFNVVRVDLVRGDQILGKLILSEREEVRDVNGDGRIERFDRFQGPAFRQTGRFYFVPEATAALNDDQPAVPGFQGVLRGAVQVDGVERELSITVVSGFSPEGGNTVTFGASPLEVARVQQRLKFLGFPGLGGPLDVDGIIGPETQHAVSVFDAAAGESGYDPAAAAQDLQFVNIDRNYINSPNAPRWVSFRTRSSGSCCWG
jgi:hypothetical protein